MDLTRHLSNLYLLVRVVEAGSYATAAREMGTTRSLLSRRISALEDALDARLLHRDARHFAVTPTGEKVYQHAVAMCDSARAAVATAREARSTNRGPLRVGMCEAALPLLSGTLATMAQRYPQVQLSTNVHNDVRPLLNQHVDVVLHVGTELPDSADIIAHPLGQAQQIIVASPGLLQQLDHPAHPDEIDGHFRLGCTVSGVTQQWPSTSTRQQNRQVRLSSDRIGPTLEAARAGIGLAQLPRYACHEDLTHGRLQQACTAFETQPLSLHALTVSGHGSDRTALDFIDYTREQIAAMSELGIEPGMPSSADS